MAEPQAAAIYARISSDQDGTALGVGRQVDDCRKLAADLGWAVAEEYVDNDLSAYSGKRRPAYERMLADLTDGHRDGVLVYHADRLTRRPVELEQFLDVVTAAGVRHVRFVAGGGVDVADGDGMLLLRVQGAVAANESATKSRRVRRKLDEVAAAGRPHGGSRRPFGFDNDRITVRPDEAAIIRTLAARYIAGESVRSLATWLQTEDIPSVTGKKWETTTVKQILISGRNAGLRRHRGEVIGPAVWDAIITPAERDKILARMAERANSGRRSPRTYLLSGQLRCGRCGNRLYSAARKTSRRYVCLSGPDHGGCGKLSVIAEPLEDLVAAAVLYRLDTPELAAALAGRAAMDLQAAEIAAQLAEDQALIDELASMVAAKQISTREWMTARRPVLERIEDLERRYGRLTSSDAIAGLAGNAEQLGRQWADQALTRKAAIVQAVVDHVAIAPGTPGARHLDPDRVDIVWRL